MKKYNKLLEIMALDEKYKDALPRYETACTYCKNAKWYLSSTGILGKELDLICYCELMCTNVYTTKEPTVLLYCEGQMENENEKDEEEEVL